MLMKYPNDSSKNYRAKTTYGNRGMSLESDLNDTNNYYNESGIAVIHKKPTCITIHKVDYLGGRDAIIKEARFRTPSTTDYNGIYKGKYIDFEAKETNNETSFPLSNIHDHQLEHLRNIIKHGGIGFLIVKFTKLEETYYLSGEHLFDFIDSNKRKSIPYSYFNSVGVLIPTGLRPRLDYLKIIEEII